jgi:hypothetical protein
LAEYFQDEKRKADRESSEAVPLALAFSLSPSPTPAGQGAPDIHCLEPCLYCGRQPSDPHHLRFAQPKVLGKKVSDEFTLPLCRGHHRQLFGINAPEIAKGLWEQTHPKSALADSIHTPPRVLKNH